MTLKKEKNDQIGQEKHHIAEGVGAPKVKIRSKKQPTNQAHLPPQPGMKKNDTKKDYTGAG